VYKSITQVEPANPEHPDFRLGKTLGVGYANWRRVKRHVLPPDILFFLQPGSVDRVRLV